MCYNIVNMALCDAVLVLANILTIPIFILRDVIDMCTSKKSLHRYIIGTIFKDVIIPHNDSWNWNEIWGGDYHILTVKKEANFVTRTWALYTYKKPVII
jgi:hypothetical protein